MISLYVIRDLIENESARFEQIAAQLRAESGTSIEEYSPFFRMAGFGPKGFVRKKVEPNKIEQETKRVEIGKAFYVISVTEYLVMKLGYSDCTQTEFVERAVATAREVLESSQTKFENLFTVKLIEEAAARLGVYHQYHLALREAGIEIRPKAGWVKD